MASHARIGCPACGFLDGHEELCPMGIPPCRCTSEPLEFDALIADPAEAVRATAAQVRAADRARFRPHPDLIDRLDPITGIVQTDIEAARERRAARVAGRLPPLRPRREG